jgi:ubiquitin-conjugating enzyme E2 S
MRRIIREINELKKCPPEGIRIQTSEEDILDVTGIIEGPGECANGASRVDAFLLNSVADQYGSEGTPYAGGYFRVKFLFTEEFPAAPPKCASSFFI